MWEDTVVRGKNKQNKRSLSELLSCELDLPAELLSGGCFVEMRGRNCVSVRGCRRIILYSQCKVILKMKRDVLQICGKRLGCVAYMGGCVSVEGLIDSVSFLHGERNEEVVG